MMVNTTDFIAKIYDLLAANLQMSKAPANLFFQMAWPGIPVSPADFKDETGKYAAYKADDMLAAIVDQVPMWNKACYFDSSLTVSGCYDLILAAAHPNGSPGEKPEDVNPGYAQWSEAQRIFKESKMDTYYPCKAIPGNWYEDAQSASWSKFTLQSKDITKVDPKSLFAQRGGTAHVNKGVWKYRRPAKTQVDIRTLLQQNSREQKSSMVAQYPWITRPGVPGLVAAGFASTAIPKGGKVKAGAGNAASPLEISQRIANSVPANPVPVNNFDNFARVIETVQNKQFDSDRRLVKPNEFDAKTRVFLNKLLISDLPTKPASDNSTEFSISFNYCRVNVERSWLNMPLLSLPNWHANGLEKGTFSNGKTDENPGIFSLLPSSFVVIKNLKISAKWSEEEKKNLADTLTFGPFDFRNGSFNKETLEAPGMQIVGFVSRVMPALAPS